MRHRICGFRVSAIPNSPYRPGGFSPALAFWGTLSTFVKPNFEGNECVLLCCSALRIIAALLSERCHLSFTSYTRQPMLKGRKQRWISHFRSWSSKIKSGPRTVTDVVSTDGVQCVHRFGSVVALQENAFQPWNAFQHNVEQHRTRCSVTVQPLVTWSQ